MQQPIHIYRSWLMFLIVIVAFAGAGIGCLLRLFLISDLEVGAEHVSLCIGAVFSGGAACWLIYELSSPEPVISLFDDKIVLRSIGPRHHVAEIPRESLIYVTTNALDGGERSDLIFTVTADCFARLHRLPAWRSASDTNLYFMLMNAHVTPSRAATIITGWMHGIRVE